MYREQVLDALDSHDGDASARAASEHVRRYAEVTIEELQAPELLDRPSGGRARHPACSPGFVSEWSPQLVRMGVNALMGVSKRQPTSGRSPGRFRLWTRAFSFLTRGRGGRPRHRRPPGQRRSGGRMRSSTLEAGHQPVETMSSWLTPTMPGTTRNQRLTEAASTVPVRVTAPAIRKRMRFFGHAPAVAHEAGAAGATGAASWEAVVVVVVKGAVMGSLYPSGYRQVPQGVRRTRLLRARRTAVGPRGLRAGLHGGPSCV